MEKMIETPGRDKSKNIFSWNRESFSLGVNMLFERYAKDDPNVELVSMNEGKSIEVKPEDEEKVIFTFALGGCYGTLVFTEHPDGRRNGVLTHYDPTVVSQNMVKLKELIDQNTAMKEAKFKQTVIVMGRGILVQNPETKKWKIEPDPESEIEVNGIISAVQAELGKDVEVRFEPYIEYKKVGREDQGVLVAIIPPINRGTARFETWFSAGKLEKEQNK